MEVSSCKCWIGVVLVQPVIILRAAFWEICSLFVFDFEIAGNHAGEA